MMIISSLQGIEIKDPGAISGRVERHWLVSRESLHNFLISFGRLIASKTFACRVFYGRRTAQTCGRRRVLDVDVDLDSELAAEWDSDSDGQRIRAVVIHLTCTRCSRRRLPLSAASCSCSFGWDKCVDFGARDININCQQKLQQLLLPLLTPCCPSW